MNIVDIVILIFILFGGLIGWKQGFTKSLVNCVGYILIIVIAFVLKNPISEFFMMYLPFFDFFGLIKGLTVLNIALYEIFSGKTREIKMWTSQYNKNPFSLGNILYIISLDKKHKKEDTGLKSLRLLFYCCFVKGFLLYFFRVRLHAPRIFTKSLPFSLPLSLPFGCTIGAP